MKRRKPIRLSSYDKIIIFFSGGKDSIACLLFILQALEDQGLDRSKVELWHHCVDGEPGSRHFMDWPVTNSYCEQLAKAFGVPILFSWREGGFYREMMRQDQATAPVQWYENGQVKQSGGNGPLNTRRKFPQVSADLRVRYCSSSLKIDVADAVLRNDLRFRGIRTLAVSGERGEESTNRSKYARFEPHRADLTYGVKFQRHIDHWRAVLEWSEQEVWAIIQRFGVVPHPGYFLGWSRLSCIDCIFANADQWASANKLRPAKIAEKIHLETEFGTTIKRDAPLSDYVANGTPYESITPELTRLAIDPVYAGQILVDPADWVLPAGAYGKSVGPT